MSITIVTAGDTPRKPSRGHAKALPRPNLNAPGRLRVGHLMTLYNLGHSTVYAHIDKKLLPPHDGVVAGRRYWRTETIKADLES